MTSWIDDFCADVGEEVSPTIFTRWAAITCIAAALEVKVWVTNRKGPLYPNLYVTLVGPAGVGKTEVIWRCRDYIKELETHNVAKSSVTKASLIDDLAEAERKLIMPEKNPPIFSFNSLFVASNELGVLLPAYDSAFMQVLTDLYDSKGYSESRRTNKIKIDIPKPNINILAGCTPNYLKETLPPGAWEQGFISRLFLIYSGVQPLQPLFALDGEEFREYGLNQELFERLCRISELYGPFQVTEEAKAYFNEWYTGGQKPAPSHPRLLSYNSRRGAHMLKLAMIASVDESLDMVLDKRHLQRALDWMVEAEFYMPDIFKAMASGGDAEVIEETYHFIYTIYMKGKKPLPEQRIVQFLIERVPSHNVARIIEVMVKAGLIKYENQTGVGNVYFPRKPSKS